MALVAVGKTCALVVEAHVAKSAVEALDAAMQPMQRQVMQLSAGAVALSDLFNSRRQQQLVQQQQQQPAGTRVAATTASSSGSGCVDVSERGACVGACGTCQNRGAHMYISVSSVIGATGPLGPFDDVHLVGADGDGGYSRIYALGGKVASYPGRPTNFSLCSVLPVAARAKLDGHDMALVAVGKTCALVVADDVAKSVVEA